MAEKSQPAQTEAHGPIIAGVPLYTDGGREHTRFVVNGFHDVWATILFLVASCVVFSLSGVYLAHLPEAQPPQHRSYGVTEAPLREMTVTAILTIAAAGLAGMALVSLGVLALLTAFPKAAIVACNAAVGVLFILLGVFSESVEGKILFIVIGVLMWVWLYAVRDRIEMSAMLMKISTQILRSYPSIIIVSFGVIAVSAVHLTLCLFAVSFFIGESETPSNDGGPMVGAMAVIFFIFWSIQISAGIVQMTSMGVAATWYFCKGAMPTNPTLHSFKRAMTTSLGSICFGSLLVAAVRFVRFLVQQLTRHGNGFVAQMALCLMGCVEYLVRRFNEYAFAHCAIYGTNYLQAARQTWELVKHCGGAVLITDILVSRTILYATVGGALVYGGFWGLIMQSWNAGMLAFFLAALVMMTILRPIRSHLTALLVCYSEVPSALQQTSPELFEKVIAAERHGTVA